MAIFSGDYQAAVEGKFFTSWQTTTTNTAVATTTKALASTSPSFVIFNGQAEGGKNMHLRYVKLALAELGASMDTAEHVGILNSGSVHTTVGTLMSTPINPNGDSGQGSLAKLYGGVNVMSTPAAASRVVHTGTIDTGLPVVDDAWTFVYGEEGINTNLIGTRTLSHSLTIPIGPVIIAPQQFYTLGFWGDSWAANSFDYRANIGWIED